MNGTDRKVSALRAIADRWDDLHEGLTSGQGLTPDEATEALTNLSRGFAHPDLDATAVHEWMTYLRDAVHKLSQYEMGFLPAEDICDYNADDEHLLSLLNKDVDDALFPLLVGVTVAQVCSECRRTLWDVRLWQKISDGGHCDYHAILFREQLANAQVARIGA